jgi:hypothetical protein
VHSKARVKAAAHSEVGVMQRRALGLRSRMAGGGGTTVSRAIEE